MPGELSRAVSDVVARMLAERDLSGRQTAQRTGIPQRSLARKLVGETAFDLDDLAALAVLLGVTATDLVAWAERPHPRG